MHLPFPTPFIYAPLVESEALNTALCELILTKAALAPGVAVSNDGGWQSADDFADWRASLADCYWILPSALPTMSPA